MNLKMRSTAVAGDQTNMEHAMELLGSCDVNANWIIVIEHSTFAP